VPRTHATRVSESRTAGPIAVATDLGSGLELANSCRVIVRALSVAFRSQDLLCDRFASEPWRSSAASIDVHVFSAQSDEFSADSEIESTRLEPRSEISCDSSTEKCSVILHAPTG